MRVSFLPVRVLVNIRVLADLAYEGVFSASGACNNFNEGAC